MGDQLDMKLELLFASFCVVAVNCLPADPSAVVPESTLSTKAASPDDLGECFPSTLKIKGKEHNILCRGIRYYVFVPKKCALHSCGLIMDIHGYGMTAKSMENLDYLTKWGKEYITIRPEDGVDKNWGTKQWDDLHKIEAFLRAAITMLRVDKRRVHVSGFSQGGFLTFNLLCRASDVICSIAPIGIPSDGKYVGGYLNGYVLDPSARKHKNCFVNGKGPKVKRSIMYQQGKHDCFFQESTFHQTVSTIKHIYGLSSDYKKLSKGKGVDWKRYKKGAIKFEAALYNYKVNLKWPSANLQGQPEIWQVAGHCIPSTKRKGKPNDMISCGNKNGYTWGEEVLRFFRANKCQSNQ